ncbi:hypothetical protein PsorP6_000396 [Peronosclerospora sorghi]|uniref:Uncharacterized protein n=1 Tax=Peronosclerospora sorghi TaxID=230839 RepID=A0ACC0WTI5_9STRA|nr:hypothetical protein PsorP6_000396 [Peronosclerospora sorghi]
MEVLEAACAALHAPPAGPEAERRRAEAEAVLNQFKQSPHALPDAMTVLGTNQTPPVVQFHCVATIREVTLQRWPLLTFSDKSRAMDFLMQFLLERGAMLPRYVAAAALQTAVLLVKRGWLDRLDSERTSILQQMRAMLQPGNAIGHRLLATKWLLAFVTEFSSASRASNMMQPIEFHTKSRCMLEKSGELKEIVALALPLLEDSIRSTTTARGDEKADGDVPPEQSELLDAAFRLCIELLNWKFEDPRAENLTWSLKVPACDDDTGNRPLLTPQASWRPVLVRRDLIHSAFNTYAFFREVAAKNEMLLHLARQFLIQLASLRGPIFERKLEQVHFLNEIFRGVVTIVHNPFLNLLAQNDVTGHELATREIIDCCRLLYRLLSNIGLKSLLETDSGQLFYSFIKELASLTTKLLHSALERIQRHLRENTAESIDDLWELEGVDILFDAWVVLVNDPLLAEASLSESTESETKQALAALSNASALVVELYIQLQLELSAAEVLAEQEEDEDVEDNAASNKQEQYELAATLARLNVSASASLLVSRVQSLMSSVQQELVKGQGQMTSVLLQLFEQLHFVVLFAGIFLADDFEGERPGISPLIQATIHSIVYPEESPVINLIMFILKYMLEFETSRLAQNPASDCISPFVSEGLLKTITRLSATYLAPDVLASSENVAPAFLQVFGIQNGGQGRELLTFLVQQTTVYLLHWPTQPIVMENVIEFLLVLSNARAIDLVLNSQPWQSLVQANASAGSFMVASASSSEATLNDAIARIPANLRGELTEALCRAGMTAADPNMRAAHFEALCQPVEQRLQQLIGLPTFGSKQTANNVPVQEELKLLLEMYSGIARSAESTSHSSITAFCLPALPVIVKIFQLFEGDSQLVYLILKFFCVMVEAQLCYLSPHDALQVYTASDDLIRTYCRLNLGKKSMLGDAEEEMYGDMLALLTLLSHLVSKDFIDFSEDVRSQQEQADASRASSVVADVVFAGVSEVIPLMTDSLLAYPSLSKQYFTLVSYMVEVYAEKLVSLSRELFQMLLHSLMVGIRHVSVDVVRNSFQALGELASYHWKALHDHKPGLEVHRQQNPDMFMAFLRMIFRMVLFQDFDPTILDACASTLYSLILIEQARYSALVNEICHDQDSLDVPKKQRLAAAFAELIRFLSSPGDVATSMPTTRKLRMQLKTNLYAFVAEVRGFLLVK